MRLKLVASTIVVETERGRFTNRLDFGEGLNVISAGNNRGKTTALMAIAYALGLEGMMGPGIVMPLKPAAYDLIADADGEEIPVLSSYVMLEIENQAGRRLTAQRWLKHDTFSRDLVRTWSSGKITRPEEPALQQDRFTRIGGSASHEAGWHRQLADFVGWSLPEVATYAGTLVPLYVQVFFPLLFIEQTRGWSSILGSVPRHLRIRDPGRRAVEFLLDLDANERARAREELRAKEGDIAAEWRAAVSAASARMEMIGGRIEGLPRSATVEWPPSTGPVLQVLVDDDFIPVAQAMSQVRTELASVPQEVPTVENSVDSASAELQNAEDRLARLNATKVQLKQEIRAQEFDLEALDERLKALNADRERYVDALKLKELGSLQPLAQKSVRCPTCDQRLPETLHGVEVEGPTLTLEANLEFIEQERSTVRAMITDGNAILEATRQRHVAVLGAVVSARREVRSAKSALTERADAPSEAFVARRVRLKDRLEELGRLEEFFSEAEDRFAELADELRGVRGRLLSLGGGGQSSNDRDKLLILAATLREQLDEYGFGSFGGVEVDMDSYLPEREGVDLNRGSSASDTVRLIWAYTIGLLEVSRAAPGNHPNLLIMDEPGQHEINIDSLRALFRRLAAAQEAAQQVVIATSVPFGEIDSLKEELGFRVHRYEGRLLARL